MTSDRDQHEESGADAEDAPDEAAPTRDDDEDRFPGVDSLLGTFMTEPSLWPVLIVMLCSGGAFGAALLVLSAIDRNPFAALALVLLIGMTLDVVIRARRIPGLRNVARMIGLVWGVSIGFAALAIWTGLAG